VIVFGVFTLTTIFASSFTELLVTRFLAGVGLGGALPNIIALTSEYAPRRARTSIITAMSCGLPAGGGSAPLFGSWLVEHSTWQATFLIGGILPLVLSLILIVALPESARFLVVTGKSPARIAAVLRRMLPTRSAEFAGEPPPRFVLREETGHSAGSIVNLLTHGRAAMSLLLWLGFFMTLLTALFMVSWLPTVLRVGGLPLSLGLVVASMFSLGGVCGTAVLGYLMDKWGPYRVLAVGYVAVAIMMGSLGYMGISPLLLGTATFTAGFFVFGSQGGLQALSASLYPTALRSSGVGWAFGIGRIGSIVGPAIGGAMLSSGWPLPDIFLAAATPAFVAFLAVVLLSRCAPERSADGELAAPMIPGELEAR
jgi:AAHS family 4-hydroxybenzoate transporter-like MFS transporter